ncbi:MAG TPA: TetR/AcrR family transcriptional regulator [Acidimicrobiales bacterium]
MATGIRMSAEERRQAVLGAAARSFAASGYEGTSTEDIARLAGISQPYIFRLFGSKKELFIAVVDRCFDRTVAAFEEAAGDLTGEEALHAMGMAYSELIQDPAILKVELHAFTASAEDADIRRAAQAGMRRVWETAAARSRLGPDDLRSWLAMGMLCNVVAALGLEGLDQSWARDLTSPMTEQFEASSA